MARLASEAKMGYYPTPDETLEKIISYLRVSYGFDSEGVHLLDPCCGEGEALQEIANAIGWRAKTYGVELDADRVICAGSVLRHVIHGSLFEVRINPLGCMGLLWLNPPYGSEASERYEMKFLKHSVKWLCEHGILAFLVPESILGNEKNRFWISQNFYGCRVYRFTRKDYSRFNQVVLLGRKKTNAGGEEIAPPPYPHIEDVEVDIVYSIPETKGPEVFQGADTFTDEEILVNRSRMINEIQRLIGEKRGIREITPLLPLRKGHLVALLTAGFLDGKIETLEGPIWVKGYSDRVVFKWTEDDREITRHTYSVGIRVLEEKGVWYDIK